MAVPAAQAVTAQVENSGCGETSAARKLLDGRFVCGKHHLGAPEYLSAKDEAMTEIRCGRRCRTSPFGWLLSRIWACNGPRATPTEPLRLGRFRALSGAAMALDQHRD
ncbi:MAG: hypothetical protein QM784_39975 [Polyangiaceae bacterium]